MKKLKVENSRSVSTVYIVRRRCDINKHLLSSSVHMYVLYHTTARAEGRHRPDVRKLHSPSYFISYCM